MLEMGLFSIKLNHEESLSYRLSGQERRYRLTNSRFMKISFSILLNFIGIIFKYINFLTDVMPKQHLIILKR